MKQHAASHKIYLLHGYGSPKCWMNKINRSLQRENFDTHNFGYRGIIDHLDAIGLQLYNDIKKSDADSISFVTHSMGGLVVRSMLRYAEKDTDFPAIVKIVMITPPNKGAEIADMLATLHFLLGPNILNMSTKPESYANKLPIPQNTQIGIIIGARGKKRGYNPFIKGDNDGLLTPEKARLDVESEIIYIRNDHFTMPLKKGVCRLVAEFLRTGRFLSRESLEMDRPD